MTPHSHRYSPNSIVAALWSSFTRLRTAATGSSIRGSCRRFAEFPFDTTRAIASLVLSGALVQFPNIRFIFCHAGGALPLLMGRLEAAVNFAYSEDERAARCPDGIPAIIRKLYFDVISMANPGAWASVRQMAEVRRLLFGTDFPFVPAAATLHGLESVDLNETECALIEHGNAAELLKGQLLCRNDVYA